MKVVCQNFEALIQIFLHFPPQLCTSKYTVDFAAPMESWISWETGHKMPDLIHHHNVFVHTFVAQGSVELFVDSIVIS